MSPYNEVDVFDYGPGVAPGMMAPAVVPPAAVAPAVVPA